MNDLCNILVVTGISSKLCWKWTILLQKAILVGNVGIIPHHLLDSCWFKSYFCINPCSNGIISFHKSVPKVKLWVCNIRLCSWSQCPLPLMTSNPMMATAYSNDYEENRVQRWLWWEEKHIAIEEMEKNRCRAIRPSVGEFGNGSVDLHASPNKTKLWTKGRQSEGQEESKQSLNKWVL